MLTGIGVRSWATHALGSSYTRTLQSVPEQRLVREGPYGRVRHPGYLGTLLVWMGAAIALANWMVAAIVSVVMIRAYGYRMQVEEEMLTRAFGREYERYVSRTRRLVPFLY
jgi:protein-S-isoprenylcysteine O-methyltransferase